MKYEATCYSLTHCEESNFLKAYYGKGQMIDSLSDLNFRNYAHVPRSAYTIRDNDLFLLYRFSTTEKVSQDRKVPLIGAPRCYLLGSNSITTRGLL